MPVLTTESKALKHAVTAPVAQNAGRDLNSSPPSLFAGADHHADKSTKCQAQNSAFLSLGPSRILVTKGKARQ